MSDIRIQITKVWYCLAIPLVPWTFGMTNDSGLWTHGYLIHSHLVYRVCWICSTIKWRFPRIVVPKSSTLVGFSIVNQPFWGSPHDCGNPQILQTGYVSKRGSNPQQRNHPLNQGCAPEDWFNRGKRAVARFYSRRTKKQLTICCTAVNKHAYIHKQSEIPACVYSQLVRSISIYTKSSKV